MKGNPRIPPAASSNNKLSKHKPHLFTRMFGHRCQNRYTNDVEDVMKCSTNRLQSIENPSHIQLAEHDDAQIRPHK